MLHHLGHYIIYIGHTWEDLRACKELIGLYMILCSSRIQITLSLIVSHLTITDMYRGVDNNSLYDNRLDLSPFKYLSFKALLPPVSMFQWWWKKEHSWVLLLGQGH